MKKAVVAGFIAMLALAVNAPARAQYPEQSVKVVVPFPAGTYPDVVARVYTQALSSKLGKPFIIENRTGAGGKVGEDAVASSPADGYTLLIGGVTRATFLRAIDPTVTEERDFLRDFTVIGSLNQTPVVMAISPKLGVKTFAEAMKKIKAEPGKHAYGSPGPGTPSQIRSAEIAKMFGLDIEHVAYRGETNALADLSQGVIAWMIDTPISVRPMAEAGKIIPVFIVSPTRLDTMPDVPTFAELGYPMFDKEMSGLYLSAPAKTPRSIVEKLNEALNSAHNDPEIQAAMKSRGQIMPPANMNLEQVRAFAEEKIVGAQRAVNAIK